MTEAVPAFRFVGVRLGGADGRMRLDGVDGCVPASGITVLVGRSGSGKSTLLRCCNRLEAPSAGTIQFRGQDVAELDVLAHRRRVGMVFQRPTPFPGTGRDNLLTAAPDLDEASAGQLFSRVGLDPELLDRNATELSGGEAQRLCLARSLAVGPEVMLLDEVTSSIDPGATRGIERLARTLADQGIAVVWVTHDLAQAHRLADELLVMVDGHLADPAEADAFFQEEHHDQ